MAESFAAGGYLYQGGVHPCPEHELRRRHLAGVSWKDVPAGTKSFVLILHDPDAPGKEVHSLGGLRHGSGYESDPREYVQTRENCRPRVRQETAGFLWVDLKRSKLPIVGAGHFRHSVASVLPVTRPERENRIKASAAPAFRIQFFPETRSYAVNCHRQGQHQVSLWVVRSCFRAFQTWQGSNRPAHRLRPR